MKLTRSTTRVAAAGILALGLAVPFTPAISGAFAAGHSTSSSATASDAIVEVTKSNLASIKEMAKTKPVIFLVTAPSWCGACQDLDPKIHKLAEANGGTYTLAIADQDKDGGADREFRVNALPTMIAWGKNGEMSNPQRFVGSDTEANLKQWLDSVVSAYGPVTPTPAPTTTPAPAPTTSPAPEPTTPAPVPTTTTPAPAPTTTPAPEPTTTTPAPAPTTTTPAPEPTTTTPAPAPTDGKLPELPPGAVQLTDDNYEAAVTQESFKRTVIIDFSKDQCGPCLQIAPVMDEKYRADAGKWQYTRLDGTAYPNLWKKFDNPWFPTLVAIKDGKEISRRSGYEGDVAAVKTWIDAVASGNAPASDPKVMDVKSDKDWDTLVAISKRHPVALRLHVDSLLPKLSGVNGKWAADMANGDGAKWTLANIDMASGAEHVAAKHDVHFHALPEMLVFYNGKVRLEPLSGRSTQEKMRAWVNTMLSTHYPEN